MQRLFSTFANGWPGAGLLLQRIVTGAMLLHSATLPLPKPPQSGADLPQIIACCPGILLLLGLWTPVAGTLVATAEIWAIVAGTTEPRLSAILATLGASLAMIGPGAWSVDARLFGRKRIDTREE